MDGTTHSQHPHPLEVDTGIASRVNEFFGELVVGGHAHPNEMIQSVFLTEPSNTKCIARVHEWEVKSIKADADS